MIPNTYYNVASVQVSALPIKVCQIEGYFKGGANARLEILYTMRERKINELNM